LRRASCTGRARLAAMVTLLWWHTHVRPGAGPMSAVAGEGGSVARAAIGHLCTQSKFNILYAVANDKVWPCLGSPPRRAKQTVLAVAYREAEANRRKPQLTAPTGGASGARR
jgi:hypothetical protein